MEEIKNRNESFYSQIEKFSNRRKVVYELLQNFGALTTHSIKDKMRLSKHQVSGRVTELKESCFIKPVWSKLNDVTNVMNTVWAVTYPEERAGLIASKLLELKDEQDILQCDINSIYISKIARELIVKRMIKIEKLIKNLK